MAGNDAALVAEIDKRVNACGIHVSVMENVTNNILKDRIYRNTIFLLMAKDGWYVTSIWDIFMTVLNVSFIYI